MRDRELTDEQRAATGPPAKDHRLVVEAILRRPRTGAPWRDLPDRSGPWQSAHTRSRRWQAAGVRDRAPAALRAAAGERGDLDRGPRFLDATVVRAHPHAAGAKKGAATGPSAAAGAGGAPICARGPSGAASR